MGLLPLVACSIVAASPGWLVVPADADDPSTTAAQSVVAAFTKVGRSALLAPPAHAVRDCPQRESAAQPDCFVAAAPGARVLLISGVALRDRFALTIAVLAKNGTVLEEAANRGALTEIDSVTQATLAKLEHTLGAREASDAPVAVTLVPREGEVVLPAAPAPSRAPAWIATGATAVLAGVAVGFLVMGLTQKSTLDGAQPGQLRHSEAASLAQGANTDLSVALGTGLGAAATGVLSGVLWGTAP
jgi:hypothetical protein